jgi:DNA-binding XRE family transcriptional regulator
MGSNEIPNTKRAITVRWDPEGSNIIPRNHDLKPRGVKPMGMREGAVPRTPFQALRMMTSMNQTEWSIVNQVSIGTITHAESGKVIPTVSLAKRMQEEARQRGIAVTLDELYQHVVPHGLSGE